MKEQLPSLEEYQERQRWAAKKAKELGIRYTPGTDYFEVPFFDKHGGKEIGANRLPLWSIIPLFNKHGEKVEEPTIDETVAALKQEPRTTLFEALRKLKAEKRN